MAFLRQQAPPGKPDTQVGHHMGCYTLLGLVGNAHPSSLSGTDQRLPTSCTKQTHWTLQSIPKVVPGGGGGEGTDGVHLQAANKETTGWPRSGATWGPPCLLLHGMTKCLLMHL